MLSLCCVQTQLQIGGGATESIFPLVELWLNEDGDHYEALQFVAARKNMEAYRSVVDFLFCEIFVQYQYACRRFYEEKGPQLKDRADVTDEKRELWEKRLLATLRYAYTLWCEQRAMTWTMFRAEALQLPLAA